MDEPNQELVHWILWAGVGIVTAMAAGMKIMWKAIRDCEIDRAHIWEEVYKLRDERKK